MKKRPATLYPLLLLLLLQAIGATGGGLTLVFAPSGRLMGMPAGMLDGSPFGDFMIPGLILLVVLGLFPGFILWSLIARPDWRWPERLNVYREIHWSWTFSLYLGIMLVSWILVQIAIIPYDPLQSIFGLVGVAVIICTLLPATMRFYGWRTTIAS